MIYLTAGFSTLWNLFQLFGLLIVFLLIIAAAFFTTRFIGNVEAGKGKQRNIKVIETHKIAAGKFLQIIEVSGKYLLIAVCKDSVEFIAELDSEQIAVEKISMEPLNFKDIMQTVKKQKDKINKKNL